MTDDIKPQPFGPPVRQANRYDTFREFERKIAALTSSQNELTTTKRDIFSMSITVSMKGERMDEPSLNEAQLSGHFLIDLVFKPVEPGLKLRPAETQLLLAYIGEILKEVEIEEKLIIEEEKAKQEDTPCR